MARTKNEKRATERATSARGPGMRPGVRKASALRLTASALRGVRAQAEARADLSHQKIHPGRERERAAKLALRDDLAGYVLDLLHVVDRSGFGIPRDLHERADLALRVADMILAGA